MIQIINGKKYNTETANVVASDRYWDGHNFERQGRNKYLYKTPIGNFFVLHETCWEGERDSIKAIDLVEAMRIYEELPEHETEFEQAFEMAPEIA